jgi:uncharacterized protein YjiK
VLIILFICVLWYDYSKPTKIKFIKKMIRIPMLILGIVLISCNNPISDSSAPKRKVNKNVLTVKRNQVLDLPEELKEISGITFLNDSVFVAIQDEEGSLFYYNINQKRIIRKQWFAKNDDYEDLAKAGKDMYVICSKGNLFQIKDFESAKPDIRTIQTPLNSKNDVEGLAFDPKNNRLLIAPKESGLDKDKTTKEIYGFNLKTMKFETQPVYTIKLKEIEEQFKGDALQESSKKFLKALGNKNMKKIFRTSAITVNEKTGELYVLSSINGLILILNPNGSLKKIMPFSGREFKQPEGIAFTPGGRLYISNEGNKSGIGNIIEIIHEN